MFQHELSPRGTVCVARSPEPPPILALFSVTSAHTHSLPPSASHTPVVPLQRPQPAKQHRQIIQPRTHLSTQGPRCHFGKLVWFTGANRTLSKTKWPQALFFFFLIPQRTKTQTKSSQSWKRLFYCRTASFCYHLLWNDTQQHQTWRSSKSTGSSCSQHHAARDSAAHCVVLHTHSKLTRVQWKHFYAMMQMPHDAQKCDVTPWLQHRNIFPFTSAHTGSTCPCNPCAVRLPPTDPLSLVTYGQTTCQLFFSV